MKLDQAFRRAGFEIVAANKIGADRLVFDIRVPLSGQIPSRWKLMMETMLSSLEDFTRRNVARWNIEIVKFFYARNGVVRYLWRITMTGDLKSCQALCVNATINSLRVGNELHEVALVGQVNMTPDPANGKYKGAIPRSDDDRGTQMISNAFLPSAG